MRSALLMLSIALVLPGCGGTPVDKPAKVHVSRVATLQGDRIISYTAMYDDGVVTYIDYEPHGEVDMITVQRDSLVNGQMLRLVRDGFLPRGVPADGPAAQPITEEWETSFGAIDGLVDVELVPWSDAHGGQ